MAGRIRAHDWAATSLGASEAWSDRLKLMVEQVLASPLVSTLVCGPGRVLIYNDAAARLYGDRHPAALGRPIPKTFPEGWATVAPLYERAFAGETISVARQPLDTRGEGDPAADAFDATLTPVRESGAVAHVHMIGTEVGERLRAETALRESEERQRFLLGLSDGLRPLSDPTEIQRMAMKLLAEKHDVMRAAYLDVAADGDTVTMAARFERDAAPTPDRLRLSDYGSDIADAFRAGRTLFVRDTETEAGSDAQREAYRAIGVRAWIVAPLVKQGRLIAVVGVQSGEPRHWTRADIRQVDDVAERTWAAVERARAETALRDSRTLLAAQNEAFLAAVSDLPLERSLDPMVRAAVSHFGETRCAFYVVEPNEAELRLVAGMTAQYADDVDGFKIDADSLACGLAVHLRQPVITPDVRLEQRWAPWLWMAEKHDYRGVWSFPMKTATGRRLGTFDFYFGRPRDADASDRAFATDLAHAAGIVISRHQEAEKRVRAEMLLRESEERFAQFGASSSDALWIRDAATLAMEYVSPAIRTIYGVSPDDLIGDPARWLALIRPEDRDGAYAHLEKARAGEEVVYEFRIRRPSDGEERWIRNTDFPLRDAQGRVQRIGGIAEDVTDAKRAAERQEVLINELQHRARNLLGVVAAIADRTLKRGGSVEAFEERLKALGRAQGLLSAGGSDTVAVGALVRAELAAHADGASNRARVAGPDVLLNARQVQNFALALHELTTNAVKYGALAGASGRLSVTWEVLLDRRGRRRLSLTWAESEVTIGPDTVKRRGYGTELIQEALAYALQAQVDYRKGPDGVRCRIEMPLA
ncbi:GAF domain-containing protein [Methylobacterium oxalidis]|uniref:Blue-light-activated histidine kinase n=1 Tax=Methylobacterium oxalidis TaxID=944322 RepID=A0A512JBL9_9HYPH|nr:GAF domain-containing protein [Methylobacterium oxalidis]GEP07362.1 hypothetical protein MOX02_54000 [Methylobacterium oxalidis]GJE33337.1 hypothetical protein LDDCCGHA_3537 [Methylobacterium oxalidis]GLS63477.1 hypothetical protein GCM10007888_18580 [Methylobacterium oxalidis]